MAAMIIKVYNRNQRQAMTFSISDYFQLSSALPATAVPPRPASLTYEAAIIADCRYTQTFREQAYANEASGIRFQVNNARRILCLHCTEMSVSA